MDASRLIISDEERRRVAALLRKEADGWAEDCPDTVTCESYDYYEFILNIVDSADIDLSKPPSMLFDRLADLIDRPTCRNIYDESKAGACANGFECSECGNVVEDCEGWLVNGIFNYCSECGRMVVE